MNHAQKLKHPTTLAAHHPRHSFLDLQREVKHAMNDFYDLFEKGDGHLAKFENLKCLPCMDLVEDDKAFKIELEMPGMEQKDIKISIADNMLRIHGEKTCSSKNKAKHYLSREINYGYYDRSIALPSSVDLDKVKASFKQGMLWITFPKKTGKLSGTRTVNITKG